MLPANKPLYTTQKEKNGVIRLKVRVDSLWRRRLVVAGGLFSLFERAVWRFWDSQTFPVVATENNPQENRLTCCTPTLLFRFGATMADVHALVNTNDPCYLYDLSPPDEMHIGHSSQQQPWVLFPPTREQTSSHCSSHKVYFVKTWKFSWYLVDKIFPSTHHLQPPVWDHSAKRKICSSCVGNSLHNYENKIIEIGKGGPL